jgi:hypothetical protein
VVLPRGPPRVAGLSPAAAHRGRRGVPGSASPRESGGGGRKASPREMNWRQAGEEKEEREREGIRRAQGKPC